MEVISPDSTIPEQSIAVNNLQQSERTKTSLTTAYTYDALGRLTGVTDPRTGTSTITYYASGMGRKGKQQSITNAAGNTTVYDYSDTTGRKISEQNALGKYIRYAYNNYGQITQLWGEAEYPLTFAYDSKGRKTSQTTYRNTSVNFNGTTFPSVTGDVISWSYDESSGLVLSKTHPDGKAVSYAYSADGKLLTRAWARGATTSYNYDAATEELLKADYSDATTDIEYTYNRLGKLTNVADAAGTRAFAYDPTFNLTGETLGNRTLNYTYATTGVKGRYTGMTGNHAYSYDQYGRINQINDIVYTRQTNSELIAQVTRPNGVNTVWSYESNRNLVAEIANGTAATLGYTNNAIGNRISMSRSGSVFTTPDVLNYTYNDRSEVTGALSDTVNTPYNYSYAFDPIGNRLTASLAGNNFSYTANLLNQYTAVNAVTPTYDDDGNMLTNGQWAYVWNGENRMIKAENSATGVKVEADYDYMGRRIFKKVYQSNSLTKHLKFVYDGYKLIEELDGLNEDALLRKYVWQPESIGLDVPLTVYDTSADKTYFYHTDANKNVTELTDGTGGIVTHYEYSPFGSLTKTEGSYAENNPFRFSSEYLDSETGLVYYNYRYYSPELGRWLSRDPIEEEGGFNLYGMVGNNTLNGWDHLGYGCAWCNPFTLIKKLLDAKKAADAIRDANTTKKNLRIANDPNSTPAQRIKALGELAKDAARNKAEGEAIQNQTEKIAKQQETISEIRYGKKTHKAGNEAYREDVSNPEGGKEK